MRELALRSEHIAPVPRHLKVARVAGEFVGAQHFDTHNCTQVELITASRVAFAIGLSSRRSADGK